MFDRRQLLLVLGLAACSPAERGAFRNASRDDDVTARPLYPNATVARVFVKEEGFGLAGDPDIAALTRGRSGVELTEAERATVSNAISIGPMPTEVTSCAPTWRHLFVFYDAAARALGALAVCFECMDISVLGPAAPNPSISSTRYRVRGLRELVEARGLLTPSDIVE